MKTKQILLKNGKALLEIKYGIDDHNGRLKFAGNDQKPYFSITGNYGESRPGRLRDGDYLTSEKTGKKFPSDEGGPIHGRILKACPSMKPLVDLHLSDFEGRPLHAIENPTYDFATNQADSATRTLRIPDDLINYVMAEITIARANTAIRMHPFPPTYTSYMHEIRPVVEKWVKFMEPIWLHQAEQAIAQFELREPSPSLS